jgi:putative ABC transport system permease protein
MSLLRVIALRLFAALRKRRPDEELATELNSHLELLVEENIRRGMTPDEARYAARREFGGIEQIKEEYRSAQGLPALEIFTQDLRYALRTLRKNAGFTTIAVLTLALGIGANTAIFGIVNAVLLRPLPFPESRRIVAVYQTMEQAGIFRNGISYPNFSDWQEQSHCFQGIGAYHSTQLTLTGAGEPESIPAAVVTSGLFTVLGVHPIAGRLLTATDDSPGAGAVVLISERLWRRRFGAKNDLVGKTITLERQPFTVAGILPAEFHFPFETPAPDLWVAVQHDPQFQSLIPRRGGHYLSAIAMLRPTMTLRQAEIELAGIQARLAKEYPNDNAGWGVRIAPLQHEIVGDVQLGLLVLVGAVGLVLLISSANVANLFLARATSRSRELAVRAALGAGRRRIVRQLLTESLLLGCIGGAVGAASAWWAVRSFESVLPDDLPRIHAIQVDGWVLGFTLGLSILVSLLFGLVPAVQATSGSLVDGLQEGARGSTDKGRKRLRSALVVSEVVFAVILLTGSGLLLRSFLELQNVSPGFQTEGILTAAVTLPQSQYKTPDEWAKFFDGALERIKTLPGVTGAAMCMPLPMSGGRINLAMQIEGRPQEPGDEASANYTSISPEYFSLLRIPLLYGRFFDDRDAPTAPKVAIISQEFARRYFPNEDPIGKHLNFGLPQQVSHEIVGIVGDVKQVSLAAPAEPEIYVPHKQGSLWVMEFAVSAAGDPAAIGSAVRERIQEADKDLPVLELQPLTTYLRDAVAQPRFRTVLVGVFGATAIALSAIGIYGVISYTVLQRTREIGVRVALGAERAQVLGLVMGHGLKLVLLGLGIGLGGALVLTRLFRSLLFGVAPGDPLTYAGTIIVLISVALLACYIPARRAMRVDPLVALRYE